MWVIQVWNGLKLSEDWKDLKSVWLVIIYATTTFSAVRFLFAKTTILSAKDFLFSVGLRNSQAPWSPSAIIWVVAAEFPLRRMCVARRVLSSPWLGEEADRASKSKDSRAFLTGSTSFLGTFFSSSTGAGAVAGLFTWGFGFSTFGFSTLGFSTTGLGSAYGFEIFFGFGPSFTQALSSTFGFSTFGFSILGFSYLGLAGEVFGFSFFFYSFLTSSFFSSTFLTGITGFFFFFCSLCLISVFGLILQRSMTLQT